MKRAGIAITLALAGCSQGDWMPPASVYRHYGDRLRVYLSPFLGQPCGATWGPRSRALPAASCYVFGPTQRMIGVLRTEGYGPASFYPGRATVPRYGQDWEHEWRAVSDRYRVTDPWPEKGDFQPSKPRNFRVVFGGRTTARFSARGERRIVIIDRIERVERLPDDR